MILESKSLKNETLLLEETLFHVANGYLGVRGNFEEKPSLPHTVRGFYLNGFYDTVELQYPERLYGFPEKVQRMINLPDVQTMKFYLNNIELTPLEISPTEYSRTLDTNDGLAKRTVKYAHDSGLIIINITRMASFKIPELFLTIVEVESENVSGQLKIHAGIDGNVRNFHNPDDPRVAAEAIKHIDITDVKIIEDGAIVEFKAAKSELKAAIVQRFDCNFDLVKLEREDYGFRATISHELNSSEPLVLTKFTLVCDSRHEINPAQKALELSDKSIAIGVCEIINMQTKYIEDFHRNGVPKVDGCPEVDRALDFNLFSLLQSTARDGLGALASKGLSGEGYEGHYFWDTEIYCFPFFLFTKPSVAKALLEFRYNTLNEARKHAKIMGHRKGALYPWRTISGSECSSYFPSGSAQYHINGDIAHSFEQYWYATGDMEFMAKKGAEVLVETARLWLEVGHYSENGNFLIHTVTGPDEYTCLVNNNYYTNRCAQANLRSAAALCEKLWDLGLANQVVLSTGITFEEIRMFKKAADSMWFPYDKALDIHPQDDSFLEKKVWDLANTPKEKMPLLLNYHPMYLYRHQICKQADTVLAHVLFGDEVSESTKRNSYNYYEKITTHDSSLSRCIFSIMAARLGLADKAYEYFMDTLYTDLRNTHGNTKDGLHAANLGGSWLALLLGFAGMELKSDGLHFSPNLPKKWNSITLKLRYKSSLIALKITKNSIDFELEEGLRTEIFVKGKKYTIEKSISVEL